MKGPFTCAFTLVIGRLSKGISEQCKSTRIVASSLLICFNATKFALLSSFILTKRQFARDFGQIHYPRMQNVHFWMTCIDQKCLCLSPLLITSDTEQAVTTADSDIQTQVFVVSTLGSKFSCIKQTWEARY